MRRVVGDSMLPALRSGQIVVVWRCRKVKIGDVVILCHDGLEKIKRVSALKDNKVFVCGDNSSASTDSRTFGWLEETAVLGKVLFARPRAD